MIHWFRSLYFPQSSQRVTLWRQKISCRFSHWRKYAVMVMCVSVLVPCIILLLRHKYTTLQKLACILAPVNTFIYLDHLGQQNNSVDAVYVSGFVTNSAFWLQLLADMFGKKIILNEVADASAVGAALIGMYATGFIKDVYEVKKFLKTDKVFMPDETNHALYQKHFERYKKLYPTFKKIG